MKRLAILTFAAFAFLIAPGTRAQAPSAADLREIAKENEAKQEELINLERETARAMQWHNGTLFRRIYGDDFVGILPSGQIKDKTGWIATVESSNAQYTSFLTSDIRVRMFQDTAVVTCLWSARGTREGQPFSRQLRVTHVYIYGQRGWQAIASQETLLPG
jgi:ketosteroid isomerase-like protein